MPPKLRADHTLYHLSPKGFWKKLRDTVVINPEISSGLPLPDVHRFPPPASRPEVYATPATKASDPAQNPYFQRDARRKYPQLSVVTQSELSQLLLGGPSQPAVASPDAKAGVPAAESTPASIPDLTAVIATITSAAKSYSANKLPPTPPSLNTWRPIRVADAPHDPNAYFPMALYGDAK
ncbi:21 kDa subunit of NADH dehydrogenase [Clavulina sp. PMI_390]|nr:21 kDa subunit of NADH dehydrogenase [Clavulina sp. PMI_390]